MRRKPPLILMEEMIMLLVFALAAALCLQAFVRSEALSERSEARDKAVTLCQNVAEALRGSGGYMGDAAWAASKRMGYHCDMGTIYQEFDEDWNPVESGVYRLDAGPGGTPNEMPYLERAHIRVAKGGNAGQEPDVLFELEVAWQREVSGGGE